MIFVDDYENFFFHQFTQIIRLKNHDENMMVSWIQNSSLYVGIDASQISFQMYQSGKTIDFSGDIFSDNIDIMYA